jgi:hypothetical protein
MRRIVSGAIAALVMLGVLVSVTAPAATAATTKAHASHVNQALLALEQVLRTGVPPAELAHSPAATVNGPVTEALALNWAGYADATTAQPVSSCGSGDGCGSVSYVSANWTIPAVTCPAPPYRNEDQFVVDWIGVDGFNNSTVEQTGTASYCFEGTPQYYNWYEMYPSNTVVLGPASCVNNNIGCPQPGDRISASIAVQPGTSGNDNYTITLNDLSSPANSGTTTQACATSVCFDNSAEWIVERPAFAPGGFVLFTPLSFFGRTEFTNGTVVANGHRSSIGGYQPSVFDINMVDASLTYYLACPEQTEPIGSLLLLPTSSTTPDPCPPEPPSGGQGFGQGGSNSSAANSSFGGNANGNGDGNAFGGGSTFYVTWDDSF